MDISRLSMSLDEDEISESDRGFSSTGSAASVCSAFAQCSDAVWSGTPKKGRKRFNPPHPRAHSFALPAKKQSTWSAEEDAQIIELRGKGVKWEDIGRQLPGRSAISCRLHYQNHLERRGEWDEDRKNKLARLYKMLKAGMWSVVAEEMSIPWRAAEAMHWQLGEAEMARRASVTSFRERAATEMPRASHDELGSRRPSQDTEPISQSLREEQQHSSVATKTAPPLFHELHSEDHQSRHQGKEVSSAAKGESCKLPYTETQARLSETVLALEDPVQGLFNNNGGVSVPLEPPYLPDEWREAISGLAGSSIVTNAEVMPNAAAEPFVFPADSECLDIIDHVNALDWPFLGELPAEPHDIACLPNSHLSSQRQVLPPPSFLTTWLEPPNMPIWLNSPLLWDHTAVPPGVDAAHDVDELSLDESARPSPSNRAKQTGSLKSLNENEEKRKSPRDSHSKVHVVKQDVKRRRLGTDVSAKRHSIHAVNLLSVWLGRHRQNPYPSAKERAQLAKDTGLTERQVRSWFTNARNRGHLSPLEAWLSCPSEDEAVLDAVIRGASKSPAPARAYDSEETKVLARKVDDTHFDFDLYSGQGDYHSPRMAPGSGDSRPGYIGTNQEKQEAKEPPQEQIDLLQYSKRSSPLFESRLGAPDLLGLSPINASLIHDDTDPSGGSSRSTFFQCTFCCKKLVEKSWKRHEESTHLPRRTWTCLFTSFRIRSSSKTMQFTKCAFCDVLNPDDSHAALHSRIEECQMRPEKDRVFVRKDGLAQHLTMFHGASTLRDDVAAEWESNNRRHDQSWTCGFCGTALDGWDLRARHIAQHFRNGATMDQWLFEPCISDL